MSTPQHLALRRAVDIIGSQSATGRLLGVSQAAVWKWLDEEKVLPGEHVLKVEAETSVSRHDLRPDLYPREEAATRHRMVDRDAPRPLADRAAS